MKKIEEMSNRELLANLFIIWGMHDISNDKKQTFIEDDEDDMISKIIHYRTKQFNVKIPTELGYIISLCSAGNPGIAIIMYHNLLSKIVESKGKLPRNGYVITTDDFARVYSTSFPDTSLPQHKATFEKMWDEQKDERGNNKVDSFEFWNQLFVEE